MCMCARSNNLKFKLYLGFPVWMAPMQALWFQKFSRLGELLPSLFRLRTTSRTLQTYPHIFWIRGVKNFPGSLFILLCSCFDKRNFFYCHFYLSFCLFIEMALLLPAALSKNRHANDSSDIRRNLRLRYRDSFKHNREHEWVLCIILGSI